MVRCARVRADRTTDRQTDKNQVKLHYFSLITSFAFIIIERNSYLCYSDCSALKVGDQIGTVLAGVDTSEGHGVTGSEAGRAGQPFVEVGVGPLQSGLS